MTLSWLTMFVQFVVSSVALASVKLIFEMFRFFLCVKHQTSKYINIFVSCDSFLQMTKKLPGIISEYRYWFCSVLNTYVNDAFWLASLSTVCWSHATTMKRQLRGDQYHKFPVCVVMNVGTPCHDWTGSIFHSIIYARCEIITDFHSSYMLNMMFCIKTWKTVFNFLSMSLKIVNFRWLFFAFQT